MRWFDTVVFKLQVLFSWFEKLPFGFTVDSFLQELRTCYEQGYVNTDVSEQLEDYVKPERKVSYRDSTCASVLICSLTQCGDLNQPPIFRAPRTIFIVVSGTPFFNKC